MKIFSVLVLYKKRLDETQTFASLVDSYLKAGISKTEFSLLVYDNSPDKQHVFLDAPFDYQYVHDPQNNGLSAAYNLALKKAVSMNYPWLLLLDHDSGLPSDYFTSIERKIYSSDESVVSFVPKMICNGAVVSPLKVILGIQFRPISKRHTGICDFQMTAINSGALVNVAFMEQIGGFNDLFKLDFLDHWLFNEIYSRGKKVYVLNSFMQHELSVNNINENMSSVRYMNILSSEKTFYLKYKTRGQNVLYLIKLFIRLIKFALFKSNKNLSHLVLRHLYALIPEVVSLYKNQ